MKIDHVRRYLGLQDEEFEKMIPAFPELPEIPGYKFPMINDWNGPECCRNCLNRPDLPGRSGWCMCALPSLLNPSW